MQDLIEQFMKEKRYLKNVTPKTVRFYYQSLNALLRTIGGVEPAALNKSLLDECIDGAVLATVCFLVSYSIVRLYEITLELEILS